MTDYQKYINALRKCAKEHDNDRTSIGHIIVSDLCRDTANLLKALQQEPCDIISRQAVIDACDQSINLFEAVDRIKELPPVNPQPKTGHWIADADRWGDIVTTVNGYRCDKCNTFNSDKDNYCPNCGCRMVEPQESEVEE